jgi:Protein of unknown function (DUF3684)
LGGVYLYLFLDSPSHIDAEVVRWVYAVGSEKPSASPKTNDPKTVTNQTSGFLSSLFAGFGTFSTPGRTPTPVPVAPNESTNLLEANSSNVVLAIFAANVDVRLDEKMTAELLRATKKNPPGRLRYELIYVGITVVECILKMGSYFCPDGERRI